MVECICKALGSKSTTAKPNQSPTHDEQEGFIGSNLCCKLVCGQQTAHTALFLGVSMWSASLFETQTAHIEVVSS